MTAAPDVKRAAIQRKSPLRACTEGLATTAKLSVPVFRPKKCAAAKGGCGEHFMPARQMQKACGGTCARAMVEKAKEKKAERAAKDDRRATRAQLEALKTVPTLKKEAQREFNRYIRLRDAALPCVSCATPAPDLSGFHAGRDAGHYRSTGSADHLRFHEDNCHAQCVKCNQWGAGMAVEYRQGLLHRIGLARLEAVESNNQPMKWTRDGLRQIRDEYRTKCKEIAG